MTTLPLRIFAATLALLSATACNTINGFGEDINSAGHAISRAADNTQTRMRQQKD
jgi:predicted small secreted protein